MEVAPGIWEFIITLPFLTIFFSSLVAFALGALWYGPLFGLLWVREKHGVDTTDHEAVRKFYRDRDLGGKGTMVLTYIGQLLQLFCLAVVLRFVSFSGTNLLYNLVVTLFILGALEWMYIVNALHSSRRFSVLLTSIDVGYVALVYFLGSLAFTWAYQSAV